MIRVFLCVWHFHARVNFFPRKANQVGKPTPILYLSGMGKFAPSHTNSKRQYPGLNSSFLRQF